MLDPILLDQPYERGKYREAYPWFFRLSAADQSEFLTYCEELDCLHEDLEFALYDLETAFELSYREDPYNRAPRRAEARDDVAHLLRAAGRGGPGRRPVRPGLPYRRDSMKDWTLTFSCSIEPGVASA